MNSTQLRVTTGERQLFLDDFGVKTRAGLTRTMHPPEKKGAVVRSDWTGGEEAALQTRSAPQYDPGAGVYKLWSGGGRRESPDGLHWTLVEEQAPPGEVVYDGGDPDPQRRFKAFFPGIRRASPDGIHWTEVPGNPVESSDEHNFSFDRRDRLFIATVKQGGPYGRAVYLSTSADFETWTEPRFIFSADEKDQELGRENIEAVLADPSLQQPKYVDPEVFNVDVYNMGAYRYESVYIGHPAMYHATGPVPNYPNTDGFHLVQLVCSRDLKTWQRLGGRKPFIGLSPLGTGAYDRQQIIGPSDAVVRGDELWFYYTGLKYRATYEWIGEYPGGEMRPLPGYEPDRGAICLAVLRRDGFVSLDAGDETGTVETREFLLPSGELHVNADAHGGELAVEMLAGDGALLASSPTLAADAADARVEWTGGNGAAAGSEVSLRFSLRNTALYSYWFE